MIEFIEAAVHRVFNDTIGEPVQKKRHPIKKGYVAKIELKRDSVVPMHCIYKEGFLVEVAKILLMEDAPDRETLEDLAKELANLFAGTAKTLASESGTQAFTISTPDFEGEYRLDATCTMRTSFEFHGHACTIHLGCVHA